jgi:hypothetical protein
MYPTPAIGWMNRERPAFLQRANADLVIALALIHHLCIAKNLSLTLLAAGLADLGTYLLIEFVPKSDPKAAMLLLQRADIFPDYTEENFRKIFSAYFILLKELELPGSSRKLLLFKRK